MHTKKASIAVIGLGRRGFGLLETFLRFLPDVEIAGVCDSNEKKMLEGQQATAKAKGKIPFGTTDYHELLKMPEVEAVVVAGSWDCHVEIAVKAMMAGKYVAVESGGAYSTEDCWRLVRAYEESGSECMMLENCCYGRNELMVLNMARNGVLGEIVHCSGGYHHDLREDIVKDPIRRQGIIQNYANRNCENYPTHALGPISKLLNIHNGNRMLMLNSVSSKAIGLKKYIKEHAPEHPLSDVDFRQGDIITTTIRCAGGETITLTLDTTLPTPYGRGFCVRGTKGMFNEETSSFFIDDVHNESVWNWQKEWGNAEKYRSRYEHPIWQEYLESDPQCKFNGMDVLVLKAFVDSVAAGKRVPIDVYDVAAWMSISALSETSIARGGATVEIPDFTNGKWMSRKEECF